MICIIIYEGYISHKMINRLCCLWWFRKCRRQYLVGLHCLQKRRWYLAAHRYHLKHKSHLVGFHSLQKHRWCLVGRHFLQRRRWCLAGHHCHRQCRWWQYQQEHRSSDRWWWQQVEHIHFDRWWQWRADSHRWWQFAQLHYLLKHSQLQQHMKWWLLQLVQSDRQKFQLFHHCSHIQLEYTFLLVQQHIFLVQDNEQFEFKQVNTELFPMFFQLVHTPQQFLQFLQEYIQLEFQPRSNQQQFVPLEFFSCGQLLRTPRFHVHREYGLFFLPCHIRCIFSRMGCIRCGFLLGSILPLLSHLARFLDLCIGYHRSRRLCQLADCRHLHRWCQLVDSRR